MKTLNNFIKINIASPKRIINWVERVLPDGQRLGEITKSVRFKIFKITKYLIFNKIFI